MARPRGRPKDAGNRKYRTQDHEDCLTIARLRLTERLKLWPAIFRAIGIPPDKHQNSRARRLHKKYTRHEGRYVYLAKLEARLVAQPTRACKADDLATALDFGAALRSAFAEQEATRARIMGDFMASQTAFHRLAAQIAAGPDWPKLDAGSSLADQLNRHLGSADLTCFGIFGKRRL